MGANDDPAVVAYRNQREARAELAAALGKDSYENVILTLLQDGAQETLKQLMIAFAIRDDEHCKRVEASLLKFVECAEAYDRLTAGRKPQESAYMGGLGRPDGPRVPRRRRRDRSR